MRVSVCVGNYAKTPYCIPGLEMNAYCMEELCYLLKENAFLLDQSLMNDELLQWIDEECGRRELARTLYPLVHRKGSLSAFVVFILKDTGFFDNRTVEEVEQVLKQGSGLSKIEKRKSQIDYLVKKKKYMTAVREYDKLLFTWKEQEKEGEPLPAVGCLASILNNKGVALTGLMLYEKAAECFFEAWEMGGDADCHKSYLAAKRMELSESEYVAFAAEHAEMYSQTLELEKDIEAVNSLWEEQPEYLQLNNRRELRQKGDMQKYYEENEKIVQNLKDSYRNSVCD